MAFSFHQVAGKNYIRDLYLAVSYLAENLELTCLLFTGNFSSSNKLFLHTCRTGILDGEPKLVLSLIPDYPMLNFMLTTAIFVAISYRLFQLTNTLKMAFIPSGDDKRLMYNIVAAGAISISLYTLSIAFCKLFHSLWDDGTI
ncbi:hypothetical protein C5167_045139 [Papaver somniferum]|uniref:Cas1p 10 TM acyl transferase domain-containing protein n=1 Tax=Papaver somniferum TaxID=3469 RepID=A0A4Y7L9Z7_PAPSO|nr:hypothetical protein C5167_045139 [Papaver somniferum]